MTSVMEPFDIPDPMLRARLYAALHRGNAGDVEFYVRACRSRKRLRILELGSGSLRITLPLVRMGHDVAGVELDEALYEQALERLKQVDVAARSEHVQLVHADMVEYRSQELFDKVLIPYSALWCLPSLEHKRRCLEAVSSQLKTDGEVILDVYSADHLRTERKSVKVRNEPLVDEFELTEHVAELSGSERYRVFERNCWWPSQKHTRVEYGLERLNDPSQRWLMVLDHHYLWRHELSELLEEVGFDTEWGADDDASGSAFEQQIIVRGRKF